MTVMPTGLAMVVIHHYEVIEPDVEALLPRRSWYLFAYLLFALTLSVRLFFLNKRTIWQKNHTYLPPYLSLDIGRFTVLALLAVLLISWTAPVLAGDLPTASQTYRTFTDQFRGVRNILSNLTASLRASVGIVSDYYGSSLALGRGTPLSDNILFTVRTPAQTPPGTRFYWKARIYDQYDAGWDSTLNTTRALAAENFNLDFPDMEDNNPGVFPFSFRVAAPVSTLFTTGQPLWISRPTQVEMGVNEDGSVDLATIRSTPTLRAGEIYGLRVSLNQVTVTALRNSSANYPKWVSDRYLQLPADITPRTRELARQIAAGLETPYDVAMAITDYLRANIEYTEVVPAIPNGVEPVDWFLFDVRQGFCNYYATAEVVLLRSLGIPARLVVGYAEGEPDDVEPIYTVRYRDAHAWPEVYFAGIGWVEFEPTASQPLLVRPLGGSDPNSQDTQEADDTENILDLQRPDQNLLDLNQADPDSVASNNPNTALFVILAAILLALSIFLLASLILRRSGLGERLPNIPIYLEKSFRRFGIRPPSFISELALRASLSPLQKAYLELNQALRRLGHPPAPTATPAERGETLAQALPPAEPSTTILVHEYQAETYNHNVQVDLPAAQTASAEIRRLSWKAYLRQLFVETPSRSR
jgi:hypothetical protein